MVDVMDMLSKLYEMLDITKEEVITFTMEDHDAQATDAYVFCDSIKRFISEFRNYYYV